MANVRVLTNIVPEELVEEAEEQYKTYVKEVPESKKIDLETYVHFYTKIFIDEEELGIKEKFLEVLKSEIASKKMDLESSKKYINLNTEDVETYNIYENLVFEDILEILFDNDYNAEYSSKEQLNYMLSFYFNNIRHIKKEYNFLIEVENIINKSYDSEVPESLIKFYNIIEPFYYETQTDLI